MRSVVATEGDDGEVDGAADESSAPTISKSARLSRRDSSSFFSVGKYKRSKPCPRSDILETESASDVRYSCLTCLASLVSALTFLVFPIFFQSYPSVYIVSYQNVARAQGRKPNRLFDGTFYLDRASEE